MSEPTITDTPAPTTLRIPVSEAQYHTLDEQATRHNKRVEEIVSALILHFGSLDSTKPIVLTDADRQHLERLLARNLTTATELVSAIQRALTCDIGGLTIELKPRTLSRLETRKGHMNLQDYLQMMVPRLLDEHVGLR